MLFIFIGLCSDLPLYINNNGYYSSQVFDELGFNSFDLIKSKQKCSNYITKYITKDCVKNEQGSIYFCSRSLKRAKSYEIMPIDFSKISEKIFENDFCKVVDFNISSLESDKILFLQFALKDKKTFFDLLYEKVF